ncbi:deoxynucleoside kinase [Calditrichota bacterium]
MALDKLKYIAIEGVIGAGKTSLAEKLSLTLGAKTIYEEFEQNPFLEEFYQDPERFAFQTQIFFLLSRYRQQQQLQQIDLFQECIVSDYLFAKDRIFATLNLSEKEMKLYDGIAKLMERDIVKSELVIYLQASTDHLMHNINKRARKMEKFITKEYIQALNELYNNFFFHYDTTPLLVINTDEIDFVNNKSDFQDVLVEISKHSSGTRYYIPQKHE